MNPRAVYLGLGSNIDAPANIRSAMDALENAFAKVRFSAVYRSPAVGFEGDDFLNLAARVETDMMPLVLSAWLHELENRQGRDRSAARWSSRTLDIDILLYGDLWLVSPSIEIPRQEILTAAHVLKPLADLAPDLIHPSERQTLAELWKQFPEPRPQLQAVSL